MACGSLLSFTSLNYNKQTSVIITIFIVISIVCVFICYPFILPFSSFNWSFPFFLFSVAQAGYFQDPNHLLLGFWIWTSTVGSKITSVYITNSSFHESVFSGTFFSLVQIVPLIEEMSNFVGVIVSDQWLQSQFTQVQLRSLKSKVKIEPLKFNFNVIHCVVLFITYVTFSFSTAVYLNKKSNR